jgi:hypothetical protein
MGIALLYMMFVPHRKHRPPQPDTGRALPFKCYDATDGTIKYEITYLKVKEWKGKDLEG